MYICSGIELPIKERRKKNNMKRIFTILTSFLVISLSLSAQTLPEKYYSENFEESDNFENWTNQSISGTALWTLDSGLAYGSINSSYEGDFNICFYSYNYNGDETRISSPSIDLSEAQNPVLKFRLVQPVWSSDQDELSVYYKLSENSEWILLSKYESNIDYWEEETVALPDASSDYYISFVGKSSYGYGIGIDDLSIVPGSDCGEPKDFNFVNIKETSALVRWQYSSNQTFEIEYGQQDFVLGTGERVSEIETNSLQINNLAAWINYEIYLRAYCNDGVSDWIGPFSFVTDCEIGLSLPYNEGFENTENPLECWQILYANYNYPAENEVIVDNTIAYKGQNSLRFSSYAVGSPYDQYLISPILNVGANTEVSLMYKTLEGSSETFAIGFSTNAINPLSSISWSENISDASSDWKEYKALIPEGSKYVVIHYQSVYEYYLFIDDLRIGLPVVCNTATDLSIIDKGSDFAQLSWANCEDVINVEFGEHGFSKGTGFKEYNFADSIVLLQNLTSNTQYDAYVLTNCEGTIIYSDVLSFFTDGICEVVSGINADEINDTSAIISWSVSEFQSQYNIEFGLSGFSQGEGTFINYTSSPNVMLTSLSPDTQYDIYVQASCLAFGGLSDWSEKYSFKTQKDGSIDDNYTYVIEDSNEEPLNTEMLISVYAVNTKIFICDYDNEIHYIDLIIENEGTQVVTAGTEIKYSVNYLSKFLFLSESVILSTDLHPGESYHFTTQSGFAFVDDQTEVKISLSDDFKRINNKTVTVSFIKLIQEIEFLNSHENVIEVTEFPVEIVTLLTSNSDIFGINNSYLWNTTENTSTIYANAEGLYTLTVSNDYCSSSSSVTLKMEEEIINDLQINYDIYPNPSNGQFVVTNPNPSVPVSFVVYDSAGRKVFTSIIAAVEQQINLEGLAAGVYNAVFTEDQNVVLKRLFIE